MLGPDGAHLLVCCKLAASGGGFRAGDSGALFAGQKHGCRVLAGELQDKTRNIVLGGGGKPAGSLDGALKQIGHWRMVRLAARRRQWIFCEGCGE
jgi:hypothetical protein